MGTIAQDILRKKHGYDQRQQVKDPVDAAESKVSGMDAKGKKEADKMDDEQPDAKGKPAKDKRDLGDSSLDGKKDAKQPEKTKEL